MLGYQSILNFLCEKITILARDYPIVQGGTMLIAFVFIFANLLVDISYAFLDPRIQHE